MPCLQGAAAGAAPSRQYAAAREVPPFFEMLLPRRQHGPWADDQDGLSGGAGVLAALPAGVQVLQVLPRACMWFAKNRQIRLDNAKLVFLWWWP